MIQFISEEITEGKLVNPTARVYLEKGLWEADFEIRFRRHYEKEAEEHEAREKERRLGKEAPGSSTDYTVPHNMTRDRERVRTWRLVFHKTDDIEQHHPKFWLDVQSVAEQISRKGKGWQREEGYKGGYKGQDKGKEGYKGKDRDKGGYQGGYKGKGKNKGEYKGTGNPQSPFVASAQASQAAAAAAATPAQAGPPYEFRGWGPALQAAAPAAAAAAAATPAAAQAAAPAVQSADVRERDAQRGVGKGQKGKIPVTPRKRVGWNDWSVGRANQDWENWGEDQGPRPPRPGGPQGHAT